MAMGTDSTLTRCAASPLNIASTVRTKARVPVKWRYLRDTVKRGINVICAYFDPPFQSFCSSMRQLSPKDERHAAISHRIPGPARTRFAYLYPVHQ